MYHTQIQSNLNITPYHNIQFTYRQLCKCLVLQFKFRLCRKIWWSSRYKSSPAIMRLCIGSNWYSEHVKSLGVLFVNFSLTSSIKKPRDGFIRLYINYGIFDPTQFQKSSISWIYTPTFWYIYIQTPWNFKF